MLIKVTIVDLPEGTPPEVIARTIAANVEHLTGETCDIRVVERDPEFGIDISSIIRN